jgi:hypothetical protein
MIHKYSVRTKREDNVISRYYYNGKELDYLDDIPHALGTAEEAHKYIINKYGYSKSLETIIEINE